MNKPSWERSHIPWKNGSLLSRWEFLPHFPSWDLFGLSGPKGQENWRRYFAQLAVQKLAIIANLTSVGAVWGEKGFFQFPRSAAHRCGKMHQSQTFSKFFLCVCGLNFLLLQFESSPPTETFSFSFRKFNCKLTRIVYRSMPRNPKSIPRCSMGREYLPSHFPVLMLP